MEVIDDVGLPPPVLAALERNELEDIPERYDFRATSLLEAPQILQLKRLHRTEIKAEASSMLWALFGKGLHVVFEMAGGQGGEWLREVRLYQELDGVVITGQMDLRRIENGLLQILDYKLTSAYGLADKIRKWTEQLNIYAWLGRREYKLEVGSAAVLGIFRDWSKANAARSTGYYPQKPFVLIPIEIWPQEKAEAFLRERIRLHTEGWALAELGEFTPCTDEDRWLDRRWVIHKPPLKKALKVTYSREEAEAWVSAQRGTFTITTVTGEPKRCVGNWCRVAEWCSQYQSELKQQKEKQPDGEAIEPGEAGGESA